MKMFSFAIGLQIWGQTNCQKEFNNYTVNNTPEDGNCLFSAIADQIGIPMSNASAVESEENIKIIFSEYGSLDNYLTMMSKDHNWGDGIIIEAAASYSKRPVNVIIKIGNQSFDAKPINLGYTEINSGEKKNHYVSLFINESVQITEDTNENSSSIKISNETRCSGKNKVDIVRRFKDDWSEQYFCIFVNNIIVCVIYSTTIAVVKEYNVRRHFKTSHKDWNKKFPINSKIRENKLRECIKKLGHQQEELRKHTSLDDYTRASFKIAWQLAMARKTI
ncbi:hypothetical protein HELRODRAFT_164900 [Helobdella robusta]|uniref:OTU domain-containing protein n=1 Tax=Helobdella robusta TaxID=6412 RepID=T1EVY0_HELRO|nr:hypothetical protein HELRODRAFT_164900 [Helobdella robusta]ESN92786.1 hypothetical protein HELRODRAFT_164900 [Helobdella robusta]